MKVLHLVGRSHRRGAELVALELADALDGLGHPGRVVAVEPGHEGGHDPALPPLVGSGGPVGLALASARLTLRLRRDPVDVVLAHGGTALKVVAGVPARHRPPVLWQRILGFPPAVLESRLRRAVWGLAARHTAGVVALTEPMVDEVRSLGFTGPAWVEPNPRRADRFLAVDPVEARAAWRSRLGLGPDAELLGLVGHLVPQKDPVAAIDVLHHLAERTTAHLVVVGSGPCRTEVSARAVALGLGDRAHFVGHRDDVETVLAALDVLLLTSREEGVPGIAVEAAMAGCPIVSYPLDGVRTVVDEGETGIVVGEPSPEAVARQVRALLDDPTLRAAMGHEARARSGRFALDTVVPAYVHHLVEVRGSSPARRWPSVDRRPNAGTSSAQPGSRS